ncbi:MAG: cytochrome c family protein [bacterium]
MKKVFSRLLFALLMVFLVSTNLFAQDKGAEKAAYTYGGVKTCKACHLAAKSGAQFKLWQKTRHANAYETLKTPKAKEAAKKAGVEDPSTSEKCVKCHVTGYSADAELKGKKYTLEEGVSCEACHGAGSGYKSRKIMKGIYAGTMKGEDYGLITPDEKVCKTCHNEESPFYKEFKFEEMAAKIAHPVPKK